MLEEVLLHVTEYTDELFIELLQEETSLLFTFRVISRVFSKILKKSLVRSEESIRVLRNYLLTLIKEPDTFGFTAEITDKTVAVVDAMCWEDKICITQLLDETETSEEILSVIILMSPYSYLQLGYEIDESAARQIAYYERVLAHPLARKILKKRSVWGLDENSPEDRLSDWVRMQVASERQRFGLSDKPYFHRVAPLYYEPKYLSEMFNVYKDFYKKSKIELQKARERMHKIIQMTSNRLFLAFKSIIITDKIIKKNFIDSVFVLYETNREREKARYNINLVAGDNVIFMVSNLLTRFLVPVVDDRAKMKKIPLDLLQKCEHLKNIEFTSISGILPHETDIDEKYDNFLSQLFYAKSLFNKISYVSICLHYDQYVTDIRRSRRALPTAPPEQRERIKSAIDIMESEVEYMRTLLSAEGILEMEIAVMIYTVTFLNEAMNSPDFNKLPIFILENTILTIERLLHIEPISGQNFFSKLTDEQIKKIYELASSVLKKKGININYKQEAVKLLLAYLQGIDYIPGVVTSVVGYFIDLQKELKNSLERLYQRGACSQILKYLLTDYRAKQELSKILQPSHITAKEDHMDTKTVFLLHLLSTLIDAQERGFEQLRKATNAESTMERATDQEKRELEESIEDLVESSNSDFQILGALEDLIFILLENCPKLFLSSLIVNRFASMLNASILALMGNASNELRLKKQRKSKFSAVLLLKARIRMYISLRCVAFARAVGEDDGMFRVSLFQKSIEICERKGVLTQGEKAHALLFMKTIENIQEQRKDCLQEVVYPDEFIDPLTFGVMKDPVLLKTSSTRVDRSTASMILMTDPKDPFTRVTLTEKDVVEDTELKQRIEEFLSNIKSK